MRKAFGLAAVGLLALAPAAFGYTDDEFDGTTLGSQWTWHDSATAGSTCTLTGTGQLQMTCREKMDFWADADRQCYIEQDAPVGTNWEVVIQIRNFDPTQPAYKSFFERTGIQLWQDNDHYAAIGTISNENGTSMGVQAFWQTQPATLPPVAWTPRYFGENAYYPVTTSPMFLRIQKTPRGYLAGMSADGVAWQEVLGRVKNPETSDGYFTNEKIRLYQSGGNDGNTGVAAPADFEFCRSTAITDAVSPVASCKEDEFNGTSLDPAWRFFPGFLPGSMSVSGGTFNLTAGYGNDMWQTIDRGAYIYQDAPTSSSFCIETKLGPQDIRAADLYNGCGLLLWQDQCNWVTIYHQRSNTVTNRFEVGYKRNGWFDGYVADFGAGLLPQFMRIVKNGATYICQYSANRTNWVDLPSGGWSYPAAMPSPEVRLFTKSILNAPNSFTPADLNRFYYTGQFDHLHVYPYSAAACDWELFE